MDMQENRLRHELTKQQAGSSNDYSNDLVQREMMLQWRDAAGLALLPDEQPVSTVRDSLYDLIPLGPREEKLIGTAPFLRLQKIKQLGFVYRIWPGATHTRYEHSLGCYYLAVRAMRSLLQRGEDGGLFGVSVSSIQTLVVAALLHDIGHYPFSHTIEELGYPVIIHEKVGRSIIEKSEIATILEKDYHLSPERVADFIDPLLHARQEMFDNIYWHHTARALQVMLVRAVFEALLCGALQVEQLVGLDDASLLSVLAETHMPISSRKLADDLEMRRPYKVVIEISRLAGRFYSRLEALFWDPQRRRHIEQLLATELANALQIEIADFEVLFDIPRPEKWEMDVWVTFSNPSVGMNSLVTWVEATGLQSDDLARYEQHQRRIRVVVPERLREPVKARKDDVLLPALERLVEM